MLGLMIVKTQTFVAFMVIKPLLLIWIMLGYNYLNCFINIICSCSCKF